MTPADPSFAAHDVIIIVLLAVVVVEMFWLVLAYKRRPRRVTMCGWAARANRQSRVNKPHQPPRPDPERVEKPLPPGFAQLGRRTARPKGLIVVPPPPPKETP